MKYLWFIVLLILILGCIGQSPSAPEESEEPELEESESGPRNYTDLTDDEILELIEQMSPIILYFYSPTCSTCHTVKPLLEELQAEYDVDIIWVSKKENKPIFELYHVVFYPAVYVYIDSEVFIEFDENDSLTRIYSQILDGTITGMHRIEYTTEDDQIIISANDLLPDTLYYITYDDHRIFVFISPTAKLFVFSGSEGCDSSWLYLKKDLIHNGQYSAQWRRDTLEMHGKMCGNLIQVPYTVTGSTIVVKIEDIVMLWTL